MPGKDVPRGRGSQTPLLPAEREQSLVEINEKGQGILRHRLTSQKKGFDYCVHADAWPNLRRISHDLTSKAISLGTPIFALGNPFGESIKKSEEVL